MLLKRDSRAPGLEKGQERLVEVDIDGPLEKSVPWEMLAMMDKFRDLSIESRRTNLRYYGASGGEALML